MPCSSKTTIYNPTHYSISRFALTGQNSNALDSTGEHQSATPDKQLNGNLYCVLLTVRALVVICKKIVVIVCQLNEMNVKFEMLLQLLNK